LRQPKQQTLYLNLISGVKLMQQISLTSLVALLLLIATAPIVRAEVERVPSQSAGPVGDATAIGPATLVSLAYQGGLSGIPGYGGLIEAYSEGRIIAKDIVNAGIKANRLPVGIQNDRNYITQVNTFLQFQLRSLGH
jgi:hypothetical protein